MSEKIELTRKEAEKIWNIINWTEVFLERIAAESKFQHFNAKKKRKALNNARRILSDKIGPELTIGMDT